MVGLAYRNGGSRASVALFLFAGASLSGSFASLGPRDGQTQDCVGELNDGDAGEGRSKGRHGVCDESVESESEKSGEEDGAHERDAFREGAVDDCDWLNGHR